MSEENKKETAKEAVETPENEELVAATPIAEKTPIIEEVKAKKIPKKRIKKEVEVPKTDELIAMTPVVEETNTVIEEVKIEEVPKKKVEKVEEFDWDKAAQNDMYSKKERSDLETEYSATLPDVVDKQVIDGTVVLVTEREVVIDINFKSDGVISFNEFKYNSELKAGDTVEVLVEKQEDKNGQLVLSHRRARVLRAWDKVNIALETGEVVNGQIMSRTKGGMIVDVFGIECFLPGSQIDVKPIRDYDEYVGKKMEFKVVKVNESFRNVVVSHKALIEADLAVQTKDIMSKLEKGQVLEGTVKNITSYGVFVDLGGIDGLVHITDLSWGRISHPDEIVSLDETINVVILDFDEGKSRIQLGLKQLDVHPWENLDENLKIGDEVDGKVVVVADYGVFVELQAGIEALLHVSEMSWSTHLRSANDFYKKGDAVKAQILTLDKDTRKMSLGVKQMTPDPWADIAVKFPVDSKHSVKVRNFTNFGIFVELIEGVDGLVHISDLSWTKKIKHPAEFTQVDAMLDVVVLDIDKGNRKISLGHKQLDVNPWDDYAKQYKEGKDYEGTVKEVFDKGAVIELSEEVEAFVPKRHTVKEDGSSLLVGETLSFRILEFSKENKKILVSHTVIFKEEFEKERKKSASAAKKVMKKIVDDKKQSTLGDLDQLSNLKTNLEKDK
ncbi:MAG: 30S ribosomal protein S1 [Flavobacteriales bacterium]|nr:30S ribosomal protein S1 [Flavobacteriales bacterium]MBT5750000.1 30S ribosomal protein S1 [Flavobacteriales bacterium]